MCRAGRALPLRSPAPYQMHMQQRSVLSSPARTAGGGSAGVGGGYSGAANLAERDEALVGRTIKIMKGPHKCACPAICHCPRALPYIPFYVSIVRQLRDCVNRIADTWLCF